MKSRRRHVALAVALAAVAALVSGCGPSRSVEAFCTTYHDEKQAFIERYSGTTNIPQDASIGQAFSAMSAGLSSLGDTVIIFDKLDKVAPEDIEPDVAAVRDSMKKTIDQAGGMATDPLGSFLGGFLTAMTSQGSWQRVSDYVSVKCEGKQPAALGGGEVSGASASPTVPVAAEATCEAVTRLDPFSASTSTAELTAGISSWLADPIASASTPDLQALQNTVTNLSPPPQRSRDSLWRVASGGAGVESQLTIWASAIQTNCPNASTYLTADTVTAFLATAPGKSPDGYRLADPRNECSGSSSESFILLTPLTQVFTCDKVIDSIDLSNGVVTTSTLPDTAASLVATSTGLAWLEVSETPADGLKAANWRVQATLADRAGTPYAHVAMPVSGDGVFDPSAQEIGSLLASGDVLLVLLRVPDGQGDWSARRVKALRVSDGRVLWTKDINTSGDITSPLPGVIAANQLRSAATGAVIGGTDRINSMSAPDSCQTQMLVNYDSDSGRYSTLYALSLGGLRVLARSTGEGVANDQSVPMPYGSKVLVHVGNDGASGTDISGKSLWTIDPSVMDGVPSLVGRWLVLKNTSGEKILVDARSGTDVTADSSQNAPKIFDLADKIPNFGSPVIGTTADDVWIRTTNNSSGAGNNDLVALPRSLVC